MWPSPSRSSHLKIDCSVLISRLGFFGDAGAAAGARRAAAPPLPREGAAEVSLDRHHRLLHGRRCRSALCARMPSATCASPAASPSPRPPAAACAAASPAAPSAGRVTCANYCVVEQRRWQQRRRARRRERLRGAVRGRRLRGGRRRVADRRQLLRPLRRQRPARGGVVERLPPVELLDVVEVGRADDGVGLGYARRGGPSRGVACGCARIFYNNSSRARRSRELLHNAQV